MRSNAVTGLGLLVVTAVTALWLGVTGNLDLYIHPRYIPLTMVFGILAVVLAIYGAGYARDETVETPAARNGGWSTRLLRYFATAVCLFGVIGLLITQPAPLTSATAGQRGMNVAVSSDTVRRPAASPLFGDTTDFANLSIKDWAGILAESDSGEFLKDKKLQVSGFITADSSDKDIFYISRFLVTCCAVDGRAIGIPVHRPGWRDSFKENDWVELRGRFIENTSLTNTAPAVVRADSLTKIERPEDVYVY